MSFKFHFRDFDFNKAQILEKRNLGKKGEAQRYVDTECQRLCEPMVPKDQNILINSCRINTVIGSGKLVYDTPYARRWYYMPANFQEGSGSGMSTVGRGNYWFERMKKTYKSRILSGVKRITGAD